MTAPTVPDAPTVQAPAHRRWILLAVIPALAVMAWQAVWPWPFFSDDAFVSLRYSDRLLHGLGLTWTDGERVEGYSNLLWVLGCALLGALGLDLVTAARALGALCTAAALWHLAAAARPTDLRTSLFAALAPLLVASSGTVMAWTLSGLEGPMLLLWLAWGCRNLTQALAAQPRTANWRARTLVRCSVPFALACFTRPDSPIWVAGTGTALGLAAMGSGFRVALSRTTWFVLLPLLAFCGQLVFRLAYYGEWVPNTAYVKAQFDPGSGAQGLDYVMAALGALRGVTVPALVGTALLALHRTTRPLAAVLALPAALWLAYLATIGGDHFPGYRLLHGALAPLALLAGLAAMHVARAGSHWCWAALLFLVPAASGVQVSRDDPRFVEVKHEIWEWRGKVVGEALARAFAGREQPRLAVDAAGVVPFYSRLPALDMLGLCDRTIAKTPFREWLLEVKARGEVHLPPGHLRGNGAYVMDESPDLILMGPPPGLPLPVFVSALEFEHDPRFRDRYRCALLDLGTTEILPGRAEPIVAPLWILLHGKAGIRTEGDRMEVPAWLFGSLRLQRPLMMRRLPPPPTTAEGAAITAGIEATGAWFYGRTAVAVPDGNGALELELRTARAELVLPMQTGIWQFTVVPANATLAVTAVGCEAGPGPGSFRIATDGDVVLALERATPTGPPMRVRSVVARRRD